MVPALDTLMFGLGRPDPLSVCEAAHRGVKADTSIFELRPADADSNAT